jgi:hypothetical protein
MVVQPSRAATVCELERAVQKACLMDGLGPVIRNRQGELNELKQFGLDPILLM